MDLKVLFIIIIFLIVFSAFADWLAPRDPDSPIFFLKQYSYIIANPALFAEIIAAILLIVFMHKIPMFRVFIPLVVFAFVMVLLLEFKREGWIG